MAVYKCILLGFGDRVDSFSEITVLTRWGALRRARSIFRATAPGCLSLELWREDKLVARIRPEEPKTRHRPF